MDLLSRYWKRLLWFAGLVCFILWLAPRCSSSWQLKHRQELLLKAIADRDMGDLKDLVSDNYLDDWGFKREDILLAMDDFTVQFAMLEIQTHDPLWVTNGSEATYAARLRFSGNPLGPIGAEIKNRAARQKHPVVFHWIKEGSWPWS